GTEPPVAQRHKQATTNEAAVVAPPSGGRTMQTASFLQGQQQQQQQMSGRADHPQLRRSLDAHRRAAGTEWTGTEPSQ
ncbi:unnamed protein product, partial [Amoebophrya sp. A25]